MRPLSAKNTANRNLFGTRPAALAIGALVLLLLAGSAAGSTILSDGNSSLTFDTRDGVLQITSWAVNGSEVVGRKWYYWRTSGTSEVPISSFTQTSLTASNNNADPGNDKLVAVYTGTGFTMTATFTLTGSTGGGLGATLAESFQLVKSGSGPLDCHLYAYNDYDIGGAGAANTLSMPTTSSAMQTAGPQSVETVYNTAGTFRQTGLAGDSPCILDSLCDAAKTTLTNAAGDVTGNTACAFQWDFRITPMMSKTITGTNTVLTPEPATLALLALGGAGLLLRRKGRAALKAAGRSASGVSLLALVALLSLSTTLYAQMGGGGMGGGGMGGGGMGGGGMGGMKSMLGWRIFEDTNLSQPSGLACASCHGSTAGFADPDHSLPVSNGSFPARVGNRNAPTAAYASYSPAFHYDAATGQYVGGQFWDGRAATLTAQAQGPFLNPLEHNMPNKAAVVSAVKNSMYGSMFTRVYGASNTVDADYQNIGDAIATWEASSQVNQFSSKYDRYLAGTETLTAQENHGLQKFASGCTGCHSMSPAADGKQVFTDFTYHNAGVPANPDNPFYDLPADLNPAGQDYVDLGLGGQLGLASEDGKFKVPTLRNIAATWPYGHNGYFATLEEVIAFMANRDLEPGRWGIAEVLANLDLELGNLNWSAQDIADVAAFLNTLTDAGMITPEPASLALMLAGAGLLALKRRRRKA